MGKFSKERIQKHLENLAVQIKLLHDFKKEPVEFLGKPKNSYAIYHAFLLAIQNVMDIGGHILASLYKQPYSEYEDIIPLLAKHKVITQNLAQKMKGMAGFRNKLVHDYIEIDAEKVYQYLQKGTEIFIIYSQVIVDFVEKL